MSDWITFQRKIERQIRWLDILLVLWMISFIFLIAALANQ